MADESRILEQKGRFRIQEIKDKKKRSKLTIRRVLKKGKSRFLFTSNEIEGDIDFPDIQIFIKDEKLEEWINFDSIWTNLQKKQIKKLRSESCNKQDNYAQSQPNNKMEVNDLNHSISKIKTSDDSDEKCIKLCCCYQEEPKEYSMSESPKSQSIKRESMKLKHTIDNNNKINQIFSLGNDGFQLISLLKKTPYSIDALKECPQFSWSFDIHK